MFNKEFRKQADPFPPLPVKIPSESSAERPTNNNMEEVIDLNELVRNKTATVFFRMKGDAMRDAGIFDHDLLVVDRSLKPVNGKIIVAILNGELLVRRFHKNFTSAFSSVILVLAISKL